MGDTERTVEAFREEVSRSVATARVVSLTALLALMLTVTGRAPEHLRHVVLLVPYLTFAVLTWVASRRGWARRALQYAIPVIDVPACFLLQSVSLSRSPFPIGAAGGSLGLFVLLLLLAALTFNRRVLVVTAIATALTEGRLQFEAGAGFKGALTSAALLALVALVSGWAGWWLSHSARQAAIKEAERRAELELAAAIAEADRTIARANADLSTAAITEAHQAIVRVNTHISSAKEEAEVRTALLVHDMKGPLTALRGVLEFVDPRAGRRIEGESLTEGLSLALSATGRLERMITDLLTVARLDRDVTSASLRDTPIAPLLSRIARTYGASARGQGVELSVSAPPELVARIDASLVERALENLVTNALRFVQTGNHIQLCAEVVENRLRLMVRNNGARVATEVRSMLFQRGMSAAASREAGNMGLGLYLCRLVAEAHGGAVALEEDPAWAVSFVLSIPDRTVEGQLMRPESPRHQSIA